MASVTQYLMYIGLGMIIPVAIGIPLLHSFLTPTDRVQNPPKFAAVVLVPTLATAAAFGLYFLISYVRGGYFIETSESMTLLMVSQGVFLTISAMSLIFVLGNINYG
jgi:hypothetical protein